VVKAQNHDQERRAKRTDGSPAQIEGFRRALAKAVQEKPGRRSAAIRGSYEGMIRQLEGELREYDQLKSGELKLPHIERLDEITVSIAHLVGPKETLHVIREDPDDDLVPECAVAGRTDTIVSADRHLLTLAQLSRHFDNAGAAIPRFD
jgi:hypothetical protein